MTPADLSVARKATVRTTVVNVGTGSTVLVAADPNRVGLIVCGNVAQLVTLSPVSPAILSQGLILSTGGALLSLNARDHPGLVAAALWAITLVVAQNVLVIECLSTAG